MSIGKNKLWLAMVLFVPTLAFASVSMELEEACYGDVNLIDSVIELVETGATTVAGLDQEEIAQVMSFLESEENTALPQPEKLRAVLAGCAEGRLFQSRNNYIINK
jgi:hypothetical protein